MKTIEEEWEKFKTELIPDDAPTSQLCDMKIAFYGGVGTAVIILLHSAQQNGEDGKKTMGNSLTGMLAELTEFMDDTLKDTK